MIAPETVNPLNLPSLPLADRKRLPNCPAIYFVIQNNEVVYIGQSRNLKNRWRGHNKLSEFKRVKEQIVISWYLVSDKNSLYSIEKSLITTFKPKLNVEAQDRHYSILAKQPVNIKLPPWLDQRIRLLSNRSEWLREAIYTKAVKDGFTGRN